jgi:hypothetical protein
VKQPCFPAGMHGTKLGDCAVSPDRSIFAFRRTCFWPFPRGIQPLRTARSNFPFRSRLSRSRSLCAAFHSPAAISPLRALPRQGRHSRPTLTTLPRDFPSARSTSAVPPPRLSFDHRLGFPRDCPFRTSSLAALALLPASSPLQARLRVTLLIRPSGS